MYRNSSKILQPPRNTLKNDFLIFSFSREFLSKIPKFYTHFFTTFFISFLAYFCYHFLEIFLLIFGLFFTETKIGKGVKEGAKSPKTIILKIVVFFAPCPRGRKGDKSHENNF